jgi:hypothetical protein
MPTLMQAVSSLVQLKRTAQGLSHHGPTVDLVDSCTLLCHFRHEQCCYYQFHNYTQPAYDSRAHPAGEHAHRLVTSAKHRHTDSYWHLRPRRWHQSAHYRRALFACHTRRVLQLPARIRQGHNKVPPTRRAHRSYRHAIPSPYSVCTLQPEQGNSCADTSWS